MFCQRKIYPCLYSFSLASSDLVIYEQFLNYYLIKVSLVNSMKTLYKDVGLAEDPNKVIGQKKKKKLPKNKKPLSKFVQDLEVEASKPTKKLFKFSKVMSKELDYYIEKYQDDYEAMARDKKNIYQDSPGQLRYKINKYKKIHKSAKNE